MARFTVHLLESCIARLSETVADTIIAREIRASLCGRDQVIRRNGVFGVREADLLNVAAETFVHSNTGFDLAFHLGVEAADKVFLWDTDSNVPDRLVEIFHKLIHGLVRRGRVEMIESADHLQHLRGFAHGLR